MPPRKAAASKRKHEESDSEAEAATSEFASDANDSDVDAPSTSKPKAKKAKTTRVAKATKTTKASKADKPVNDQPTNKVLPVQINFPAKNEGCVRVATWNICGLAAAQKKVRKYTFSCFSSSRYSINSWRLFEVNRIGLLYVSLLL